MGVPIPNGKLGMWLFLGTEIMFFTALIGTYIVLRLGSPGWPTNPEVTHIRIWAGGLNTFVLITSSVFVVLAHEAMGNKKYKLATNWVIGTTVLAFVFLGIKTYEYWGKFNHDILPGHVAEDAQQARDKLARELDAAAGLSAFQQEETRLTNAITLAQSKGKTVEGLNKDLDALHARMNELDPLITEYRQLRDKAKFTALPLSEARQMLEKLKANPKELKDGRTIGSVFASVREPHPIKWGNTFASVYFTMTGFHAIHVILGIVMFAIVIWLGVANRLGAQHQLVVENFGLYWHFVDLVWIFLFPLIYII
jgi:cytochrome c oxidase subunit 3